MLEETAPVLELFHARRKKASTIFCSQYHDSGWYDQLGGDDSLLAEAILMWSVDKGYLITASKPTASYVPMPVSCIMDG